MPEKRRIKRYQFSIPLFCEMFMNDNIINVRVKQGWPEDATIVGLHSDQRSYSFSVLVQSEEFDPVELNAEIPPGDIIFENNEPLELPITIGHDYCEEIGKVRVEDRHTIMQLAPEEVIGAAKFKPLEHFEPAIAYNVIEEKDGVITKAELIGVSLIPKISSDVEEKK